MLPEAGTMAIILAFCLALIQLISASRWLGVPALGRVAATGQAFFLGIAMLCLMVSMARCDFTVIYVQAHAHRDLPLLYRLGASWGGHEGSLLLWCVILAFWSTLFAWWGRDRLSEACHTRILSVLGLITGGFLLFLLLTSNPFWRIFSLTPVTGEDLPAVLQDPGLIFHPPMLYSGYAGFAIAFAFAIAILVKGHTEPHWARALRPFVLLPWALLGTGIVLGSWWSYRELGWGGWWFWDPVENASLMPWLAATALLHSLIVTERRGVFAGWSLLLALLTFTLSLLGTFLVRSGVLVSVHAFATDPARGLFLLGWLGLIVGGSLLLYTSRIGEFYTSPRLALFSRETFLLANTLLLLSGVVVLITGTLYPILMDILEAGKISVGEPYFTTLFTPLMLGLLVLMAIVPHLRWGTSSHFSFKTLWFHSLLGVVLAVFLPWSMDWPYHGMTSVGLFCAGAMLAATLGQAKRLKSLPMVLAHAGVALLATGVTVNLSYSMERQLRVAPGETFSFAGYSLNFVARASAKGPNYTETRAIFDVSRHQHPVGTLSAARQSYTSHNEVFSHPAILFNAIRDIYLAPGDIYKDGSWAIRLYYRPFVRWIWAGGLLMMAGGLLSVLASRKSRS